MFTKLYKKVFKLENTVKSVFKDHPGDDQKKMVF